MSGAEDLARLSQTIDLANELFLSSEIKMVNVGGSQQRPTNAKVLADLSTQMSGALIYTTVALGLAGTVSGSYFSVLSSLTDEYIILYRNNAGVALEVKRYPSAELLASMKSLIDYVQDSGLNAMELMDENRFMLAKFMSDGALELIGGILQSLGNGFELYGQDGFSSVRLGFDESLINGLGVKAEDADGLEISDHNGFVVGALRKDQVYFGPQVPVKESVSSPLLGRQQRTDHMMIVGYSQSLGVGETSKPAISLSQEYGNLMLAGGVKVMPGDSGYTNSSYAPLVEVDFGNRGETPVSGACNGMVRRAVEGGEVAADWVFIGAACGRGGKSVEELSPAPMGEGYFEKMQQVVKDCAALSAGLGKSFSVWAYTWDQGESNYTIAGTKSPYQYIQYQLAIFDKLTETVLASSNQKFRPYIFSYQVGAHRKYNLDNMSIALAHWRASKDREDVVLVTPVYIIPTGEDLLHLTNEGSWLLGEYRSRAMYETLIRRSGKWRPLEPVSVDWAVDHIDIKFHVPRGELVLDAALASLAPNFGFDVRESGAVVDIISSVAVTGRDTVRIALSRAAASSAVLSYARGRNSDPEASGPVSGARGNLRDTHGLYDIAQSPLGTSFALHNACVMFQFDRKTGF